MLTAAAVAAGSGHTQHDARGSTTHTAAAAAVAAVAAMRICMYDQIRLEQIRPGLDLCAGCIIRHVLPQAPVAP